MNVDPNWLNLLGQCMNLVGGLLFGLDAIGASHFLSKLDSTHEHEPRRAKLAFVSAINRAFVYIFASLIGIGGLLFAGVDSVPALLLAPLVPIAWRLLSRAAKQLQKTVGRLGPPGQQLIDRRGNLGCAVGCLWLLPWIPLYFVVSLFAIAVEFLLDLPLRFFSERVVGPIIIWMMRFAAKLEREDAEWSFRTNSFFGVLLVLIGFLYQAIATLIVLAKP